MRNTVKILLAVFGLSAAQHYRGSHRHHDQNNGNPDQWSDPNGNGWSDPNNGDGWSDPNNVNGWSDPNNGNGWSDPNTGNGYDSNSVNTYNSNGDNTGNNYPSNGSSSNVDTSSGTSSTSNTSNGYSSNINTNSISSSSSTSASTSTTGVASSASFIQACLDAHNKERNSLGLNSLTWREDLAGTSKIWADHLASVGSLSHSSYSDTYGENVGYQTWVQGVDTAPIIIQNWIDEKQYFINGRYPDISTTGNAGDVGHFSQVVWRTTTQVGCGMTRTGDRDYLVCEYDPAGNWVGDQVY